MTIQELYNFLDKFIKEHPKCKEKKIMVKRLDNDSSWEEVTSISDTVVSGCSQYGSPLYFHSPTQEAVTRQYQERLKEMDDDDEYYV